MKHLLKVEVARTTMLGSDLCQIELTGMAGSLPPYGPGDHIQFHLSNGLVRSYSLVGRWRKGAAYKVAVRRASPSRGGSAFMHTLKAGDSLSISAPVKNFPLSLSTDVSRVFLAGGIGITPLISMLEVLNDLGQAPTLYYAGRSVNSMPFLDDLDAMLGSRLHVATEEDGTTLDLNAVISSLPANAELYMCGPVGMLNVVQAMWGDSGREPAALRFETFAAGGQHPNEAFSVTVPRLNLTLEVLENETLLDALERKGVEPLYNCRKGECGLCAVEVIELDGTIDHRDVFYSEEQKAAGTTFCSCVSRITGGRVSIDFP